MSVERSKAIRFIFAARKASNIKRFHLLYTQRQNFTGQHSYNAAMLALSCLSDPECTLDRNQIKSAVVALLLHDIPELEIGDISAKALWSNELLKKAIGDAEMAWTVDNVPDALIGYMPLWRPEAPVSEEGQKVDRLIDWCDRMELVMFCKEEIMLGNQALNRCYRAGCEYLNERSQFAALNWPMLYEAYVLTTQAETNGILL